MGNDYSMSGNYNFTGGLENVQFNFTPEQVDAINQQAQQQIQGFFAAPENQPPVPPAPAPPVDSTNVIDPNWDPAVLNQVMTDLGKVYNGTTPTFADINQSLASTVYYKDTAFDFLDGKYTHISHLSPDTDPNSILIFNYHGQIYYTSISNKYIFTQLNYTFQKSHDGYLYAIDPNKQPYEIFPTVDFSAPSGSVNTQPIFVPPETSGGSGSGQLVDVNPPANDNPLDNLQAVDIVPPPVEVAPPLQETSEFDLIQYAPLLLVGAAILGMTSKK